MNISQRGPQNQNTTEQLGQVTRQFEKKPTFHLKWSVYHIDAKNAFHMRREKPDIPEPEGYQLSHRLTENHDPSQHHEVKTLQIEIEHELIYEKIKSLYNTGKLDNIDQGTKLEFKKQQMLKVTISNSNNNDIQKLEQLIQKLEKQLYESSCEMSELVKKYILTNMNQELREFEKSTINFKFENYYKKPQPSLSLCYEFKMLTIVQGNISMLECLGIANISTSQVQLNNPKNAEEIDYNICAMAGTDYIQAYNEYVSRKRGEVFFYELKSGRHIQYILNLNPDKKDSLTDIAQLEENLTLIFEEARNLQIITLGLPILCVDPKKYTYKQNAIIFLNTVINLLFSFKFPFARIYLVEPKLSKFIELKKILVKLVKPKQQVKYQWQCLDELKEKFYEKEENIPKTPIYGQEYEKIQTVYMENILRGQNVEISEMDYSSASNLKHRMISQSFDPKINQEVFDKINDNLKNASIEVRLQIPNFARQNLKNLVAILAQRCLKIMGTVQQGNIITVEIFRNQKSEFEQIIEASLWNSQKYPITWQFQLDNYQKILLSDSSPDYIRIKKLFQLTEKGQIHQIYRIQNLLLWNNYIYEKQKLLESHQEQGTILTQLEQERYVWHGVQNSHPSIIYSGQQEAFDFTYSRDGMWGRGIYFAENASYSRNYSYRITLQDDPDNVAKLVFLCCLITTGKVEVRHPDQNIMRPSPGYDCVSGFTNCSDVFILYGMSIRRAYPAFEVVYT